MLIPLFVLLTPILASAAEKPPNVLFILTDDQRPDTIGAGGNKIISTPHLDRLTRRGTGFSFAHCAHPLCVPSRVEILTGTTGFTNGILQRGSMKLKPGLPFWPAVMRDSGYDTCYVGKWHTAGRPRDRGYAQTLGLFSSGGGRFWKPKTDYKGDPVTGYRGWIFQTNDRKLFPEQGVGLTPNISAKFADAAIQFLKRKSTKPYFLHVNFTAPHDPLLWPPGFKEKYRADSMPLPPNYLPEHPFDHGNLRGRDEKLLPWPRTKKAIQENLAVYYAVISHLDQQIGRILTALKESGQEDNTIVIFSSDHGLAVGSHGLMGKQNMYDHTVQVPLILAGPGIPKAANRNGIVYLRDLFPTVCDLTGIKVPKGVEGKSVVPLLKDRRKAIHKRAFCYFNDSQRMIRDHQWKLISYPRINKYQLFHRPTDPFEKRDLAKVPQHRDTFARLKQELKAWQEQVKDPVLKETP